MNIELDGIQLVAPGVTGADIRSVFDISTSDKRNMAEQVIPGMDGSIFQDLGRSPVRIAFNGIINGISARNTLETLRSKFKLGKPVPFHSDVTGAADITRVMIEELQITSTAGNMNSYRYFVALREHRDPPPEPVPPQPRDEEAKAWAEEVAGEAAESINTITGKVLDADGGPGANVAVIASGPDGEYFEETNAEGIYRIENLPPGQYTLSVMASEYAGDSRSVQIGSKKDGEYSLDLDVMKQDTPAEDPEIIELDKIEKELKQAEAEIEALINEAGTAVAEKTMEITYEAIKSAADLLTDRVHRLRERLTYIMGHASRVAALLKYASDLKKKIRERILDIIKSELKSAGKKIEDTVEEVEEYVEDALDDAVEEVEDMARDLANETSDDFDDYEEAYDDVVEEVEEAWDEAEEAVDEFMDDLFGDEEEE